MISFIVIGRNEGENLGNCFNSIYSAVRANNLVNPEVIYVDSCSTDNSVIVAKSYNKLNIKVYKITDNYNSAIARNIGANESNGEVLFFIDGDMEISPPFLSEVLYEDNTAKYDYVSGQLINRFYDHDGNYIRDEKAYNNLNNDRVEKTAGGVFLIKREIWFAVGGMKTKYLRSQDLDIGLRLANKKQIYLIRKKETIAIHNTVAYYDKKRIIQYFKNYRVLLFKGVLIRDHIFNRHIYSRIVRMDFTLFILTISIILSIFINKAFLFVYFSVILLRTTINYFRGKRDIVHLFIYYIVRDLAALIGGLVFFPKSKVYTYIEIT